MMLGTGVMLQERYEILEQIEKRMGDPDEKTA